MLWYPLFLDITKLFGLSQHFGQAGFGVEKQLVHSKAFSADAAMIGHGTHLP
jgi:hypothetical protein